MIEQKILKDRSFAICLILGLIVGVLNGELVFGSSG